MTELNTIKCAVDEQETTITISRTDAGVRIYTSDNTYLTKFRKLLNAEGSQWELVQTTYDRDGNPTGYFIECKDKRLVRFKAKKAKGRIVSEEEKAAARLRMKEMRARAKNNI